MKTNANATTPAQTPDAQPVKAATHTPGPWTIHTEFPNSRYILGGQYDFGHFEGWSDDGVTTKEEDDANARLIASAPALLAERDALRAVLKSLADACQKSRRHIVLNEDDGLACYNETAEEVNKARAALAKGAAQ